jgi:hypothetical protein
MEVKLINGLPFQITISYYKSRCWKIPGSPTLLHHKLFPLSSTLCLFSFLFVADLTKVQTSAYCVSNSGIMGAIWFFVPAVKMPARKTTHNECTHCRNIHIAAGKSVRSDTSQRKLSTTKISP